MRTVITITPAATFPVTVLDVRLMLNLEIADDDELIADLIRASCDTVRQYLRRSLHPETLELRMDGFPGYDESRELALGPGMHVVSIPWLENGNGRAIDLPFGPVSSVESITTYGRDNAATVMDVAAYEHDRRRVYLNEGYSWPVSLRRMDSVAIRYVSGEVEVPASIKAGIMQHVAAMYECRDGCDIPEAAKALLATYRRLDPMGF